MVDAQQGMVRSARYVLKIYDIPLVSFTVMEDSYGRLNAVIHSVNADQRHLLPIALMPEPTPQGIVSWLEGRTIPKNREFVNQILATANLSAGDTLGIIDVCKGLSINDAFWVDNEKDALVFEDINLFDNNLDETLALVAYTGYTSSQRHKLGLSTEWTTNGQFAKAWRRIDGELYLYKAGSEHFANAGMEPYSEYFAAQIAQAMGLDHVPYDLEIWKGKLASVCPLMNSKDTSFVPFWVATGHSQFPANLAIAHAISPDVFSCVRSMLVFDALVCNTDRHAGNYGFIRDNHTGALIGFAPLFDHNFSLFPRAMSDEYSAFSSLARDVLTPAASRISFNDQARLVMGVTQHEQLRKLLTFNLHNHPQHPVPAQRLEALNNYLRLRVRELLDIPFVIEDRLTQNMQAEYESLTDPVPVTSSQWVRTIHGKAGVKAEIEKRVCASRESVTPAVVVGKPVRK